MAMLIIGGCLLTLVPLFASAIGIDSAVTPCAIRDRWIVTMKKGLTPERFEAHQRWVLSMLNEPPPKNTSRRILEKTFDFGNFKGYSGSFSGLVIRQIVASDDVPDPTLSHHLTRVDRL